MNTRMALAGIILLLVAACGQPPTPIPEFVADEEYAVYHDLLIVNKEMWSIPEGTETVVLFDHTFVRHDADDVRAILNGKAGVSEELVANYLEANSRSYPLEAEFGMGKPVLLVSQEAAKNLVRGLEYGEQCSAAVWAVYPRPEYGGWYYLSRVGFDARRQTALIYIEQSLCGGAGNFLVLENASGVWQIKDWAIGLQSDPLRLDSPAEVSDEEYAVYNALLAASKEFSLGSEYQYITIYDQTGLSETLTREGENLYPALCQEMPTVTEELVTNLIAANPEPYALAPRFAFKVPVVLVSWGEYEALSAELEQHECLTVARERFPYPEFQGWLRLSRVGFNQAMDQALVHVESHLCGDAGFVVLLEKQDDLWGMTAYAPFPANMPATTSQPPSNFGAALIVTPTLQTLPAGSSAEFGLAIVPSCQTESNAFGVDQLPAGWTAEFLGSPIPCKETLVLNTPGTARPGSYSIRATATPETDLFTWAELTVEILPCVEFQTGEFSQAMHANLVTLVTGGKPSVEHGLLVPLQVCGAEPGRRLLVTLTEVISEAGSRMASPPRFYLYRSLVWPEPNSIVAHGAPGTLNVGLPRTENEDWQLEAEITPGLYLLVFERDYYGSSPHPETIPASLTYRLETLP
ncbi:MAG TPA: hypothetical protein VLY63_08230 [Anaerolineae bacterium]|nr:hypothetical protein [Anaerolineae bacterium]